MRGGLEDRPGVVPHAPNQRGVEHDAVPRARLPLDRPRDGSESLDDLPHRRHGPAQALERGRPLGRVRRGHDEREEPRDRAFVVPGEAQLPLDALASDLVELVERHEDVGLTGGVEAAMRRDRGEQPPVVQADRRALEAERQERLGGREDELDLRDLGRDPQDVDVALGELPEPALLGPLGAPHRADLDGLERVRQL